MTFFKIAPIFLALTISAIPFTHAQSQQLNNCEAQYFEASEPTKKGNDLWQLCFDQFTILYSGQTKTPVWVAEHLTASRIQKAQGLKRPKYGPFHTEDTVPEEFRSSLADYHSASTTFDRGHMAPSGDMPNQKSQFNSFTLANVVPQAACNNEEIWEGLESAIRDAALKYGDVYVVTGPIYDLQPPQTIGKNKVAVPTRLFKAVYIPGLTKPGVYIIDNTNNAGTDYHVFNVKSFIELTGIDPFPSLPSNMKAEVGTLPMPNEPHFSCRLD